MPVKILTSLFLCACFAFALQKALLFFQQSGYKCGKYYFSAFRGRYLAAYILISLTVLALNIFSQEWGYYAAAGGAAVLLIVSLTVKNKGKAKYTKRAARIFAAALLLAFIATFFLPCLAILLFPLLLPFASYALFPFELFINAYYIDKAKSRIASTQAVKIGITGSYGKTSVKNILCKMLSQQFNCIATPKSYNTPLGIASFVNSLYKNGKRSGKNEGLNQYQFVIFELGAKRKGDISTLCEMTLPRYGILTAIDGCHLETFLTLENVAQCKREMLLYLKPCDVCVLSADSPLAALSENVGTCRKIFAGLSGSDVFADNITLTSYGSNFTLHLEGEEITCYTPLLGSHSISNICLCAALAKSLGVTAQNIAKSIGELPSVPHRLSITNRGSLTIIDDSYNANLRGVEALAQVLNLFDKKRIVVTQGIAEGGKDSERVNVEAGKILSCACDAAYITGVNRAALKSGLLQGGMKEENICLCKNIKEAVDDMQKYFNNPAVVAFQNDLPDCFN